MHGPRASPPRPISTCECKQLELLEINPAERRGTKDDNPRCHARFEGSGVDMEWGELADKPGSVLDCHSSGTIVADALKQPTRKPRGPRDRFPIWPCSGWGLPCHHVLPRMRCALTAPFRPYHACLAAPFGGLFSVALSVGSRRPGVTWHPALWSPDFPPRIAAPRQSGQLRRGY